MADEQLAPQLYVIPADVRDRLLTLLQSVKSNLDAEREMVRRLPLMHVGRNERLHHLRRGREKITADIEALEAARPAATLFVHSNSPRGAE